jgi:cell wall assembly regulator SMI1
MPAAPRAPDAWRRLAAMLPESLRADLNAGASDEARAAVRSALVQDLPDDAFAAHAIHDGQSGDAPGLFVGLRFLPLADGLAERAKWLDVTADLPDMDDGIRSVPEGAVRPVAFHPLWLPIADDGAGNGLALDFAPAAGTPGQVVSFGSDESERRVLAPSFAALLGWLADRLEKGDAEVRGGEVMLRRPLGGWAEHLLDVADVYFGS